MWYQHHKNYTPIKKWYQAVIAWSFRQLIPINPDHMGVSTKEEDLSATIVFRQKFCPRWGSNSRPSDYETDALPTALRRHCIWGGQNFPLWETENICTHGGTRTPNLRFRRPTPYPLGHAGSGHQRSEKSKWAQKYIVRRPGIEPGSQEWESCMIPLHQRRALQLKSPLPPEFPCGGE